MKIPAASTDAKPIQAPHSRENDIRYRLGKRAGRQRYLGAVG
jgi:hypothetical protein